LWGAQTQRSLEFFAIGEQRMPMAVVHAVAQVKRAAAQVNATLGLLDAVKAAAIAAAATRVATGEFDAEFPWAVAHALAVANCGCQKTNPVAPSCPARSTPRRWRR
jgi:fumarate hydratase class II